MNAKLSKIRFLGLAFIMLLITSGCQEKRLSLDIQLRSIIASEGIQPLPEKTQISPEMIALGQALFFDKELSGNRDISCATCHHPLLNTVDNLPLSMGVGGKGLGPTRNLPSDRLLIARNAPDVFNRGHPDWHTMFWDGRISGDPVSGFKSPAGDQLPDDLDNILAVQAMFPVTSPDEMRGKPGDSDVFGHDNEIGGMGDTDFTAIWKALIGRLLGNQSYRQLFAAAFPDVAIDQFGFQHAANAIAAFEIAMFTYNDSPWDLYVSGDDNAMSELEKQGALLFYGEARCGQCHSGTLLTDQQFHNIGAPQIGPGKGAESPEDFGRGRETGSVEDNYTFRTPPLRNVALTGPWLHDGAYDNLRDVIIHHLDPENALKNYSGTYLTTTFSSQIHNDTANINAILSTLNPTIADMPALNDQQINQILAFLNALTSPSTNDLRQCIPESVPSNLALVE